MKTTIIPDPDFRSRTLSLYPALEDPSGGQIPAEIIRRAAEQHEALEIPDVITINTWFFRKYRGNLFSVLNRMLESGQLDHTAGVRVLNRRINRGCCDFPSVRFWELGRENFLADVRVEIELETPRGPELFRGVLTYMFTVDDTHFSGSVCEFRQANMMPERDETPLSPFLIPYAKGPELDRFGELLWKRYLPEALTNPDLRRGQRLAELMGLRVRHEPIHDREGLDSLLFFAAGEIEIEVDTEVPGKQEIRSILIPAGTIVVNTNRVRREHSDFAVFHECVHWEKHYLFYRLQEKWSSDPKKFKTKTVHVRPGDSLTDPFYWMEKQGNRGAYALMLPAEDTRRVIGEEISAAPPCPHRGYLMEHVIHRMWARLGVPYFRIRARMIQMGYPEARGAMNHVDGSWIEPFAFSEESLRSEEQTFVVSRVETMQMREEYPGFREILDSGAYVYADGHVVQAEETRRSPAGLELLSEEAGARVDKYCLRFVRVYEQKHPGQYVPGRMNFDADYAKRTAFFLADTINSRQLDELDAREVYIREFPTDFRDAFDLVMHQNGMTREMTAEVMNLTPKTLYRMLREPEKYISRDFVITAALIWQMPDWLTELLMDRAGLRLRDGDKRHRALRYIARVMWMDGVAKANEYLKSLDMGILMI